MQVNYTKKPVFVSSNLIKIFIFTNFVKVQKYFDKLRGKYRESSFIQLNLNALL